MDNLDALSMLLYGKKADVREWLGGPDAKILLDAKHAIEFRLHPNKVMDAIDAEPELPGEMPDEMWEAIKNDKDAMTELLRITVRATKSGIKNRILGKEEVTDGNASNS